VDVADNFDPPAGLLAEGHPRADIEAELATPEVQEILGNFGLA